MINRINKSLLIIANIMLVLTIFVTIFYNEITYAANIINNPSTTEIPELTHVDEEALEFQEIEGKEFEIQGEEAYEHANKNEVYSGVDLKIGPTYYSQIDSRWKDILYTSTGNKNQTIGSSGCGPTSSAMVVTSIKQVILPSDMADLYVKNGFRSANNGTYFSAFPWTAKIFNIQYQETYYLDTAINLVRNNNYVIASVGNGLFTTGGHFIVIVGIEGNMLKIYDPYLYAGKFDTPSRRGKVTVSGNTVYCSIDSFKNYANYSRFFAFQNDGDNTNGNTGHANIEGYTRYVKTRTGIGVNVRTGPGINYNKVTAYSDGTKVKVYETQGNWSKIENGLWISSDYLVEIYNDNIGDLTFNKYNVIVTAKSGLNIRKGASTSYSKIGAYSYGKIVTIIAQSGNWGRTTDGWISLDYTSKTTNSANTSSYVIKTVIAKSGLNVRTSATINSRKVTAYPYGTKVKVYFTSNGWCKVDNGYMYASYLK